MTDPIQLYYKNALADVIGDEHGIHSAELDELQVSIEKLTQKMTSDRSRGVLSDGSDPNRKIDFMDLPYRDLPYRLDMGERAKSLAAELAGQFDNLVVLGIGGSALGNIALQTALNSPWYNLRPDRPGPRLFVMDNIDPVQFGHLLDYLEPQLDKTLFNVISKSGETAETAAQFLTVRRLLRDKGLPLSKHILATTDAQSGIMRDIVDSEGLTALEVPQGVGGRFSVLSHVGLFSAALCGIDIEDLLAGARDMDKRVQNPQLRENPAALFAAMQYLFYHKDKHLSVMMSYSYQLKDLCDWFRQLWAESLGKAEDLQFRKAGVGPTPIKALGATDQHSQVQLYREGPNDKVFTFLDVANFDHEVIIPNAGPVEKLSYLSDRKMSDLINHEKRGTEYALVQSQRPCLTLRFPRITPHTVGQFIYLLEVATSYAGELFGINTYDQPAVQLGKVATFALMGHPDYQDLAENINPITQIDPSFLV